MISNEVTLLRLMHVYLVVSCLGSYQVYTSLVPSHPRPLAGQLGMRLTSISLGEWMYFDTHQIRCCIFDFAAGNTIDINSAYKSQKKKNRLQWYFVYIGCSQQDYTSVNTQFLGQILVPHVLYLPDETWVRVHVNNLYPHSNVSPTPYRHTHNFVELW